MTIEQLKAMKKQLNWTNAALAKQAGVPLSTVAKILGGTTKNPRQDSVQAIENALREGLVLRGDSTDDFDSNDTLRPDSAPAASMSVDSMPSGSPAAAPQISPESGHSSAFSYTYTIPTNTAAAPSVVREPNYYVYGTEARKEDNNKRNTPRESFSAARSSDTPDAHDSRDIPNNPDSPDIPDISDALPQPTISDALPQPPQPRQAPYRSGAHTIDEYLKLPDEPRVELIDGQFYTMEAPSWLHQKILLHIWKTIDTCIEEHNADCEAMTAPYDVQLFNDPYTVVQPDVMIFCHIPYKDVQMRAHTAPDFVAEVLSPSTGFRDRTQKLCRYRDAGVKEVWIVSPKKQKIWVYRFFAGREDPEEYTFHDAVPLAISDNRCAVDFSKILKYVK